MMTRTSKAITGLICLAFLLGGCPGRSTQPAAPTTRPAATANLFHKLFTREGAPSGGTPSFVIMNGDVWDSTETRPATRPTEDTDDTILMPVED